MFYGVVDIGTFILGTIFIVLIPGPNSLYVMTTASRQGHKAGFASALGVFCGDALLMLMTAMGAATLLQAHAVVFTALQVFGAGYLMYLGVGLLRESWAMWRAGHLEKPAQPQLDKRHPFKRALVISLLNPKAILFFVSFFIQFVSPDYDTPALSFLILASIVQAVSLLYLTVLIYGGVGLSKLFARHGKLSAVGNGSVGLIFLLFGGKMILDALALA
ncbi:MAG: leucine efflux protein LeuE [Pseudomonadota bacterium]|jgi:leucine efflux protein